MKPHAVIIPALIIFSIVCAQHGRIRKGPYLIYPGNATNMTVLWQMENSDSCRLVWGATPACTTGSVFTRETGQDIDEHQHIHTITGLTPDLLYHYQVIENGITHYGSFRSAPPETADSTSFFIYGDTRSFPARHDSVMSGICRQIHNTPQCQTLLLHSGDWNTGSSETCWDQEYFNRWYKNTLEVLSKIPVLGARGNHEDDGILFKKYWPYTRATTTGACHAFNYGPVHVSVIDQYTDYSSGSEQFRWLEDDLASSGREWKFILLHEPGFSDAGAHENNFHVQTSIQSLCLKYDVRGVFAGHNHFYAHCIVDDVHHLTLGGGGAPLYEAAKRGDGHVMSETSLHYAYVNVRPDSAIFTINRPDGTLIEYFSMAKKPRPPEPPVHPAKKNRQLNMYAIQSLKILVIEMDDYENAALKIVNISGKVMFRSRLKAQRTVIDLASYPNGVYFAEIPSEKPALPQKKFLL